MKQQILKFYLSKADDEQVSDEITDNLFLK